MEFSAPLLLHLLFAYSYLNDEQIKITEFEGANSNRQ